MTTERILPRIALPVFPRPDAAEPRPDAAALGGGAAALGADAATRRGEALLSTPVRASMLVGASAAVYAVSLAAVSGLQSASDAALIARRQPWLDQVAAARAANDELEAALLRASTEAKALGDAYAQAGGAIERYEERLDALAALVAEVKGSAAALPSRIGLPKVTVRGAGVTRPATTATSGASGG